MEPLKAETDALREVMFTPVEQFVSDKEREERGEEKAEALAHKRMFSQAIKAVDKARGERTTYMVVLRFGRGDTTFYKAFGPYPSKGTAEKDVLKAGVFEYTAYAVVPMRNAEGLAALVEELDTRPLGNGDWAVVAEDAKAVKKGWKGKQNDRAKFLERVM